MNTMIFNFIAKLINSDKIATFVRGLASAWVTAGFIWLGSQVPFIAPFLTPELNAALVATIVGLAVGGWGLVAKNISAPTPTEQAKIATAMVAADIITPKVAAEIKADPTILAPDKAVGDI